MRKTLFTSCRVTLGGVVERYERENMFREEYQQRAVEEVIKKRKRHALDTENLLMLQEDKYSELRREKEYEQLQKEDDQYTEMMRIRVAKNQACTLLIFA